MRLVVRLMAGPQMRLAVGVASLVNPTQMSFGCSLDWPSICVYIAWSTEENLYWSFAVNDRLDLLVDRVHQALNHLQETVNHAKEVHESDVMLLSASLETVQAVLNNFADNIASEAEANVVAIDIALLPRTPGLGPL
jgi:hypothetical protein